MTASTKTASTMTASTKTAPLQAPAAQVAASPGTDTFVAGPLLAAESSAALAAAIEQLGAERAAMSEQPSLQEVGGVSRVMKVYLSASIAIALIAVAYLALLAFGTGKTDDRLPTAGVNEQKSGSSSSFASQSLEPRASIAIRQPGAADGSAGTGTDAVGGAGGAEPVIASTGTVSPAIEVRLVEVQEIAPAAVSPELRLVQLRAEVDSLARERETLLARLSSYELGNASFTQPIGPDQFANQTTDARMAAMPGAAQPGAGEDTLSSVTGYVIEPDAQAPQAVQATVSPGADEPAARAAKSLSDALSETLDLNALGTPRAPKPDEIAPANGAQAGAAATSAEAIAGDQPVLTTALAVPLAKPELPPIDPVSLTLPGRKVYGIALAEAPSLEMLRLNWDLLLEREGVGFLGALGPRYQTRQSQFQPSYRLIAGPIANASEAQQICRDLATQNLSCQLTVYSGADL